MYKVLLVDDERIIREGIAQSVNWPEYRCELAGTARNGIEAYEWIRQETPAIVITDIKMPGMDGLGLIGRVKQEFPEIEFIILSGYGEFDFAKQAMAYGVRHYILKPCNAQKITEALSKVIKEIEQRKNRESYLKRIIDDFNRVKPQLKAQFLKEFITGQVSLEEDMVSYSRLFQLDVTCQKVRLMLAQIEGEFTLEHGYAFMKIVTDCLDQDLIMTTMVGEDVLLLMNDLPLEKLLYYMLEVKNTFFELYGLDATIAVSEADALERSPALFREVKKYLKYRFYLGEGSIITKNDVHDNDGQQEPILAYDYEGLSNLVKSGNREEVRLRIEGFFQRLAAVVLDLNRTKTYCLELFTIIIRESPAERIGEDMKKLVAIAEMETLDQIRQYILEIADGITKAHFDYNMRRHNKWIHRVLKLIEENLDREELSLKWLAQELLYMNPDYLGKLFKREMKEKFSDYLLRVRMEEAINLVTTTNLRIGEIAERVGYGSNSQYFSQVFKKYTGYAPREYRAQQA